MADNISKEARSSLMSKIKSRETKLEKSVRKILSEKKTKYIKNSSKHFGKPDILIASKKIVIFIKYTRHTAISVYVKKQVNNIIIKPFARK